MNGPTLQGQQINQRPSSSEVPIFVMQVIVSFCLISLSIGMLVSGRGDTSIYLPVLTSVTATWLPNPKAPPSLFSNAVQQPTVQQQALQGVEERVTQLQKHTTTELAVFDIESGLPADNVKNKNHL